MQLFRSLQQFQNPEGKCGKIRNLVEIWIRYNQVQSESGKTGYNLNPVQPGTIITGYNPVQPGTIWIWYNRVQSESSTIGYNLNPVQPGITLAFFPQNIYTIANVTQSQMDRHTLAEVEMEHSLQKFK